MPKEKHTEPMEKLTVAVPVVIYKQLEALRERMAKREPTKHIALVDAARAALEAGVLICE